jgi:hypothetical protein
LTKNSHKAKDRTCLPASSHQPSEIPLYSIPKAWNL